MFRGHTMPYRSRFQNQIRLDQPPPSYTQIHPGKYLNRNYPQRASSSWPLSIVHSGLTAWCRGWWDLGCYKHCLEKGVWRPRLLNYSMLVWLGVLSPQFSHQTQHRLLNSPLTLDIPSVPYSAASPCPLVRNNCAATPHSLTPSWEVPHCCLSLLHPALLFPNARPSFCSIHSNCPRHFPLCLLAPDTVLCSAIQARLMLVINSVCTVSSQDHTLLLLSHRDTERVSETHSMTFTYIHQLLALMFCLSI